MSTMKCKNCNHKVILDDGRWVHWNDTIHSNFNFKVYEEDCKCFKPEPKYKRLLA